MNSSFSGKVKEDYKAGNGDAQNYRQKDLLLLLCTRDLCPES